MAEHTPAEPLVGREEELARVEALLAGAPDAPATLVLEGEPGIGKTTLWKAGVAHARELGRRVLQARPAEPEAELPFAALGDLLGGVRDELGGLPAPQRRALRIALVLEDAAGEPPEQRAIAAATLELLRRLAAERPLVVALDDVQWLDPPSAAALRYALRRLDGERVAVLATRRAGAAGPDLDDCERLHLGPLPLPAIDRLVRVRLGARFLRPTLLQLESASGGNPFYALELARSLLRSGRRIEPGEPLPVPSSLRELVRDRLAMLAPRAHAAALAAAALPQPAVAVVDRVARGGVAEAVAAGVLERDGELLQFSHPLLASTLYEDASPDERRELHARLADAVEGAEERARHLAEAARGPDEALAAALEAVAAAVAARGAPDTATQLARRAVELTPGECQPVTRRQRVAPARYIRRAGDPRRAATLLRSQLDVARPGRERAEVALELGDASLSIRGSDEARTFYRAALGELEGSGEVELRARVLVELASLDMAETRVDADTPEQALALAEEVGEPTLLSRALGLYAGKLDLNGLRPSDEFWERALAVEERSGELRIDGPTTARGLEHAFMQGEWEAGAVLLRRVADSMRGRADPALPFQLLTLADVARNVGDWDVAEAYIAEASELGAQLGLEAELPVWLAYDGRIAMLRGDLEQARAKSEEALRLFEAMPHPDPLVRGLPHSILARIALQAGRLDEAHSLLNRNLDHIRQSTFRAALFEPLADYVACLVGLGELEQARFALRELHDLAAELAAPPFDALLARARGLLAAAEGDTEAALAELRHAVELLESLPSTGWPYELARTLLLLGEVERRARQKLAARRSLERALAIFERLGARGWAERTRAELSRIGGRPPRSGALTPTERRIASLVASGRSNAEVAHELSLSPKTVEWNLSKVYRKLHVRSRTELAATLAGTTASRA